MDSPSSVNRAPPPSLPVWDGPVPVWAQPGAGAGDVDAAFLAGAALTRLDALVRAEPVWAGAWRQRQALRCAAMAVRLAGRTEDEAALRDAWHYRPAHAGASGGGVSALGPSGNILAAWRRLASKTPGADGDTLAAIVDLLGLRWQDGFADLPEQLRDLARSAIAPPAAAAAIATRVAAVDPSADLFGWWLADLVLAQKLGWARPVPLLIAQARSPLLRTMADDAAGVRGPSRTRPGGIGFERAVCLALAQGTIEACRSAAGIARRADRLLSIAPKLRAKGAAEVIGLLLDDDAVAGTLTTRSLSRFGARRLFERLQGFEAVRELSGRPTFRLYGL